MIFNIAIVVFLIFLWWAFCNWISSKRNMPARSNPNRRNFSDRPPFSGV